MPLSQNDYIGNPVFSTRRPKVFVLAGEFKVHNKSDLEMFIRQTGGIVRDKLSPGVDILVAGDRSDQDKDNAREYAVHAMSEEQLLKYIRRDFLPK
jgi:NAD-dependent DNA ligase